MVRTIVNWLATVEVLEPIRIVVGICVDIEMPQITAAIRGHRIPTQRSPNAGIVIALLHV